MYIWNALNVVYATSGLFTYSHSIYRAFNASPLSVSSTNKSNDCCCCFYFRFLSSFLFDERRVEREREWERKSFWCSTGINAHKQWNQIKIIVSCNRNENLNPLAGSCIVMQLCFHSVLFWKARKNDFVCAMAKKLFAHPYRNHYPKVKLNWTTLKNAKEMVSNQLNARQYKHNAEKLAKTVSASTSTRTRTRTHTLTITSTQHNVDVRSVAVAHTSQ